MRDVRCADAGDPHHDHDPQGRLQSRRATPPAPSDGGVLSSGGGSGAANGEGLQGFDRDRAERVEAALATAEAQASRRAGARQLDRARAEAADLRRELDGARGELAEAKGQLIENLVALSEKDAELERAYNGLAEAAKERTALRRELRGLEVELLAAQREIEGMQGAFGTLAQVMDGIEVDPNGSFDEENYAGTIAAAGSQQELGRTAQELRELTGRIAEEARADAEKHGIGTSDYNSTTPGADLVGLIENSRELLAKSKTALRKRDGRHRP